VEVIPPALVHAGKNPGGSEFPPERGNGVGKRFFALSLGGSGFAHF